MALRGKKNELDMSKRSAKEQEEFQRKALYEGDSFCITCDDLLRDTLLLNGRKGSGVKIFCNSGYQRKQLHLLCGRYGLGHTTQKVSLDKPGERAHYMKMSAKELRALGLIKRPPNGCVPECCGYELVHGKVPVLISCIHDPSDEESILPPSVRELSKVKKIPKRAVTPVIPCDMVLPPLPRDCISHIFSFLHVADVLNGLRVCKLWNQALNASVVLWKSLYIRKVKERERKKKKKQNSTNQKVFTEKSNAKHMDAPVQYWKNEVLREHFAYCTNQTIASCRAAPKHQHVSVK
jgi:hypothetical protein